ncbi:hypothetical protein [Tessaracoccus antarcticus]|uniref:Uncharacterized protein n=1 Tax=Tessaracoccus antarcticus TaxID=2479848 RepID=A0A3M0GEQ4_9ACTN|nr:hypothetical protein [Tessaracoccus antarcticus]RMB60073.1 hypothetical protein EAX62_10220 [Tessaracoccus antarcticus]
MNKTVYIVDHVVIVDPRDGTPPARVRETGSVGTDHAHRGEFKGSRMHLLFASDAWLGNSVLEE